MLGDYHRERRRLYESYQREVEALKIRYGIPDVERERASRILTGAVIRQVSRAVRGLQGEFTVRDVIRAMVRLEEGTGSAPNRVSITTCLRRLTQGQRPILVQVKPGVGRRPAVYRLRSAGHRPIGNHPSEEFYREEEAPF